MTACLDWKDRLLDAALGAPPSRELGQHLMGCATCQAALSELRVRREQMDSALRELAQGAEASPAFPARLLASLETRSGPPRWVGGRPAQVGGVLAAAAAVVVMAILLVPANKKRASLTQPPAVPVSDLSLSHWQSPTEALLHSSADRLLHSSPRLDEFYFPINPAPPGGHLERRTRRKP